MAAMPQPIRGGLMKLGNVAAAENSFFSSLSRSLSLSLSASFNAANINGGRKNGRREKSKIFWSRLKPDLTRRNLHRAYVRDLP